MTTDVGHVQKRRGRRAEGKRRTPRVAIAASALAAASIPLWPSAADAANEPDQWNSASHTVTVNGVSCVVWVYSLRGGDFVLGETTVSGGVHPLDCSSSTGVAVTYVTLRGDTQYASANSSGYSATVSASNAKTLTQSDHEVRFWACDCIKEFTLYSPK
jgi:hypothetical protein